MYVKQKMCNLSNAFGQSSSSDDTHGMFLQSKISQFRFEIETMELETPNESMTDHVLLEVLKARTVTEALASVSILHASNIAPPNHLRNLILTPQPRVSLKPPSSSPSYFSSGYP